MWVQLSDAIQTWVEALDNFDIIQEASAGMELLTAIQGLRFIVQRTKSTKYSCPLGQMPITFSKKTRMLQLQILQTIQQCH